jgi:site-specific recombinase XerD
MQELVEDFIQHLRNERGQSENTQKAYFGLLRRFVDWAEHQQGLTDWKQVRLSHLMSFLNSNGSVLCSMSRRQSARLSSESVYLQIAALRAFYRFAESEKLLPSNTAEHLSLPRRWKRLPKSLTDEEIEKLLNPSSRRRRHRFAIRRYSSWRTLPACASPSCATFASSNCNSMPDSFTSLARETRNASCRWAGKQSRP